MISGPERAGLRAAIAAERGDLAAATDRVRMPAEVRDATAFTTLDPDTVIDLRETIWLTSEAAAGLGRLALRGKVRVLMLPGSMLSKLLRMFQDALRYRGQFVWELHLCPSNE